MGAFCAPLPYAEEVEEIPVDPELEEFWGIHVPHIPIVSTVANKAISLGKKGVNVVGSGVNKVGGLAKGAVNKVGGLAKGAAGKIGLGGKKPAPKRTPKRKIKAKRVKKTRKAKMRVRDGGNHLITAKRITEAVKDLIYEFV